MLEEREGSFTWIFRAMGAGGWVGSWAAEGKEADETSGVEAIYPRKRLSLPAKDHQIYPYLLREVEIDQPNKVWATDITYIRLKHGFVYSVAVMDVFSRYIISWRLANTLEPVLL